MNNRQLEKLFHQATQHHQAGRLSEASKAYQQVLAAAPVHAPSLHLLGVLAMQAGQTSVAIDLIAKAVDFEPAVVSYQNALGEALRVAGRLDDAAEVFRAAMRLDPRFAPAVSNLGLIRQLQGRLDDAIRLYRRSLELAPGQVAAMINLGAAYKDRGDLSAALQILEQAVTLAPQDPTLRLNLGNVRISADDATGAEAEFRLGLQHDPNSASLHSNLAFALRAQNRVEEALGEDSRAVALEPDHPNAQWNKALDHLLLGQFGEGWQCFAWRFRAGAVPPHMLTAPEWQGGPLAGQHLLVHGEQGLGDTLQFARFLPELGRFGPAKITFLCHPGLITLLRHSGFETGLQIGGPEDLPAHDLRIALLDLPLSLGVAERDLPGRTRYIRAPIERVQFWQQEFRRMDGKKIGIVWKGRPDHANDRNRSIPLAELAPLFATPGYKFVSLQKEASEEEQAFLAGRNVADISLALPDLIEAAAAIEALDLVMTVDTALAHLAGAIGRPTWILLPFAPDWRWMLGRIDSPWYPTARLFRQPSPCDWPSVVQDVAVALNSGF